MKAAALAWSKLRFGYGRSLVAMIGISLTTTLLFFQFGALGATYYTATLLLDHFQYDILMTSGDYADLSRPSDFPKHWLYQAKTVPGIEAARSVTIGSGLWRDLQKEDRTLPELDRRNRQRWGITVLGLDLAQMDQILRMRPESPIFDTPDDLERFRQGLARLDTVIMDRRSRPEFGDKTLLKPGVRTELNGQQVELIGFFEIGTGFSYTGLLMTSEDNLFRFFPKSRSRVTLGFLKLKPGVNVEATKFRLQAELNTSEVKIFTRNEINKQEQAFWISNTAIGQIFVLGVLVAILVGFIFVTQMMTGDVRKHLPEFATLKAMGYPPFFMSKIVLFQSFFLAGGGFLIGFAMSIGIYELIRLVPRIPIQMDIFKFGITLFLVVGMCMASGIWALRRVHEADPAELF